MPLQRLEGGPGVEPGGGGGGVGHAQTLPTASVQATGISHTSRIGSVEGKGTTATARLPRVPGPAIDLAGSRVVPEADRDVCEIPVA